MTVLPPFFRRHALVTLLNLFGLTAGIAGFLMVSLYVAGELSVDRGFTGADRLYRVASTLSLGGNVVVLGASTPLLAEPLAQDFPEVEAVTRASEEVVELREGDRGFDVPLLWADPNLLQVLDYPLVQGDAATALARPDGLVVTPALAHTLFGDADPMGRTLQAPDGQMLTVTGVLRPLAETHLNFKAIAADSGRGAKNWAHMAGEQWSHVGETAVYARLMPGASPEAVQGRFADFVKRRAVLTELPDDMRAGFLSLRLDPVPAIHLHIKTFNQVKPGGDVGTLGILSGAALLILGVAIANYTNLATAQAIQRAREVGIRKLAGARRWQLVALFTGESVALAIAGTLAALAVVEVLLPPFQALVERSLSFSLLRGGAFLALVSATPVVVGVLGGLYPALVLSGYRPAEVLKGGVAPAAGRLRAVLVVAQFAISIALIITTVTVQRQVDHARSAALGFQSENLYIIGRLPNDAQRAATMKAELARLPGVRAAAFSNLVPADISQSMGEFTVPADAHGATPGKIFMPEFSADPEFITTYGLDLKAGMPLPPGWRPTEKGGPSYVWLTEAAAKRLGYPNPADAVGDHYTADEGEVVQVAGVIGNVRFRTARDADEALMFAIGSSGGFLSVRLAAGDPRPAVAAVNALVDKLYPEARRVPRGFADDRLEAQYRTEERQAKVFAIFSALAIILANLGLFGLTALAAARRTKEIGIRRVVGARARDIAWLLAWQFARPVLIANLIAWPVAWWGLHRWLMQFTVRVDQAPLTFVAAGGAALAVALATVAVHVIRVTQAPPVGALRYE
ncbi:FtsX-like permease family protein [Nitrospirillum iridis]|uniref:Putative ABC transport system permease protein n=1 Tax=Nitrospirillum iridis TaxID=765888 RepID=A0A7X0EDS0_9PROT|nr:FtsX-like permease family protein [Nitrospirillum iridis]MBB6250694.1 putative ABC transport system permease protein [Nitrospirillum iridis]